MHCRSRWLIPLIFLVAVNLAMLISPQVFVNNNHSYFSLWKKNTCIIDIIFDKLSYPKNFFNIPF
jgi:hypothetical protein